MSSLSAALAPLDCRGQAFDAVDEVQSQVSFRAGLQDSGDTLQQFLEHNSQLQARQLHSQAHVRASAFA